MKPIIHDLIESVANKFDLPNDQAAEKVLKFFKGKTVRINPVGLR
jgi:hypothetical protein